MFNEMLHFGIEIFVIKTIYEEPSCDGIDGDIIFMDKDCWFCPHLNRMRTSSKGKNSMKND